MPKGGARVGAGRKKGPKRGVVLGMHGRIRVPPAAEPFEDSEGLAVPPADLPPSRQELWRLWAPHAIKEGQLMPSRVLGFRQLIAQLDMVETLDAQLLLLGTATREAADARNAYIKLAQRLDSSMARFKLTSSGKYEQPAKPKAAANPWGAFGSGQGQK